MQYWTKQEIDFLRENLHHSTKDIYLRFCDHYGSAERTYDSVQKKIKKLRDAMSEEPDEEEQQVEPPQDLVFPSVTGERKRVIKEEAKWWLEGIIEVSKELEFSPDDFVRSDGTSLCVLISDTHLGKHNENFDLQTGAERIVSVPEKILKASHHPSVDEVVVILMGDLVEGEDIFQTQAHHIDCSAIEQVMTASESLWEMILGFRNKFKCSVRVETVPGNHGRMSRTANEKTNWDNVIYHIIRVMAKMYNDPMVIVNCNFSWFKTFPVKDKIGMAYHHGVKHTGTPAMREKVAGWSANKNFDFMVHGHWHEWHVGNWLSRIVVSNGCLCGPDDLAEKIAREDTARQAFFYVTPGQPIHGFSCIEWPKKCQEKLLKDF